ncbi:MAG: ferrochelatase [Gemmataceae bacterium]|nr:ferrochelatase [Gemmataceae bacterium]
MSIRGARSQSDPRFDESARHYDALLFLSFGGPEGMDDVMPFLENVTRGRNVPRERLLEVAEHYHHYGGVSPINRQNRDLIAALEADLAAHGIELPIYFGNRNWTPFVGDTIARMKADGVRRALVFATSAFSSYSGCRQYRENVIDAMAALGLTDDDIAFDKLRVFYNHPGYIGPMARLVRQALDRFPADRRGEVEVVFTAHSIPLAMARNCAYEAQLREACRLVAEAIGITNWRLCYQSRSGPPQVPWLEPDILDVLDELHAAGRDDVVVSPIGFISDHLEVLYDLDDEARAKADALGMRMVRGATVGTDPEFVAMIRQLIEERMTDRPVRLALGLRGPNHDVCPVNCCLTGAPARPSAQPAAVAVRGD